MLLAHAPRASLFVRSPIMASSRVFAAVVGWLAVLSTAAAQTLYFNWPTSPEVGVDFSMTWSGGTPPYTVYVLTTDETKYYYKYTGTALNTAYDFQLDAGTKVVMQCRDSAGLEVTSPTIAVIASLQLHYPTAPEVGVASPITWNGGLAPYTIYVLTADQSKYYWKYSGTAVSQQWTPSVTAGTQVVFQAVDDNGVKATSDIVTVNANGAAASASQISVLSIQSVSSLQALSTLSVASVASVNSQTGGGTTTSSTSPPSSPTSSTASSPTLTPSSSNAPPSSSSSATSTTNSGGNGSPTSSSTSATSTGSNAAGGSSGGGGKSSTNVGAIAGGVVGGVLGLAIIAALAFLIHRRTQNHGAGGLGSEDGMYGGAGGVGGGGAGEKPVGDMGAREPTLPVMGAGAAAAGAGAGYAAAEGYGAHEQQQQQGQYRPESMGSYGYNPNSPSYAQSQVTAGAAGVGAAGYYGGGGAQNDWQQQQTPSPSHSSFPNPNTYPAYPSSQLNPAPGSPMPSTVAQSISYSGTPQPRTVSTEPSGMDQRLSMFSEDSTALPYAQGPAGHGGSGPGAGSTTPGWRGLPEVS